MAAQTLYWHDYETTGADARRDRPLQFAGLRTDLDLNPVEEPAVVYCRPPADVLPAPAACAITGITPQRAEHDGVCEAEFAAAVLEELARPGTCALGYNSLRFDDEVTRHLLWRNLYDAYAREWRDGNSRWDVIDVFRLARALRPEGFEWPDHESGMPSFRLEDLARANGVEHDAHDALADVQATIELTRRLRSAQPKLYEWAFSRRDKRSAADLLVPGGQPVLHVSEKYGAARGCIAPVVALAEHPSNRNGMIVADLAGDIGPLLEWDAEALAQALFTPAAEREADTPWIPLKVVKLNAAPVLAPMGTLSGEAAERLGIDPEHTRDVLQVLQETADLAGRVREVFAPPTAEPGDVDVALYEGFVSDADRDRMDAVHRRAPEELATFDPGFTDARLQEVYFRYRARNWPASLSAAEAERWRGLRSVRLLAGGAGSPRSLADFREQLADAVASGLVSVELAGELEAWAGSLTADLAAAGAGTDA
ncbi:MAG: exodeoxyribonuclease I [Halofilum sp. (in: g-proteobacteria)]|nr:exodeoxyribonuclease I [Halofilum sp. (in: g-proteobacteria)]